MTTRIRLLYYLLLFILCIIIPFFSLVFFSQITSGDDEVALVYTLLPSSFLTQFVFGLIFIKAPVFERILVAIFLGVVAFGLFALQLNTNPFETGFDSFGLLDKVLYNFLSGLIVCELYFQIHKRFLSVEKKFY